jgi:hypothetical protein
VGKLYDDYFVKRPDRAAVTESLRAVTKPVTKPLPSRKGGRPPKYENGAARAKAYRERKRARA